jgi:hypothetical protein
MNPNLTLQLLAQSDGKNRLLPFLREADLQITDLNMRREPVPTGARILPGSAIIEHFPANGATCSVGGKDEKGINVLADNNEP